MFWFDPGLVKTYFLGFNVCTAAQSHAVHWNQEYDQEEGLLYEDYTKIIRRLTLSLYTALLNVTK